MQIELALAQKMKTVATITRTAAMAMTMRLTLIGLTMATTKMPVMYKKNKIATVYFKVVPETDTNKRKQGIVDDN